MKIKKTYIMLAVLIVICITILVIVIYNEKSIETINIENINWNRYNSSDYTVIVKNNGQFVDEVGNVINEFKFKNSIFPNYTYKKYDSNKIWFRGKNHNENALKYDIYGYYDISNNDTEYYEYYFDDNKEDSINIESVLPLESNVEGRYKYFSLDSGFYLYDQKLNKGVNLSHDTYEQATFVQLNETSGFFNDSLLNDFCFVDFENCVVNYPIDQSTTDENVEINGIYGIYENKLVAGTLDGEFVLVDKDFNISTLCENINENFTWIASVNFIDEDCAIVAQEGSRDNITIGEQSVVRVVMSYIDLENKTMTKIRDIENNGNGHFRFLYSDNEYLYIYSYASENEYKIILLDKESLKYEKELLLDKDLFEDDYFNTPFIMKNINK